MNDGGSGHELGRVQVLGLVGGLIDNAATPAEENLMSAALVAGYTVFGGHKQLRDKVAQSVKLPENIHFILLFIERHRAVGGLLLA